MVIFHSFLYVYQRIRIFCFWISHKLQFYCFFSAKSASLLLCVSAIFFCYVFLVFCLLFFVLISLAALLVCCCFCFLCCFVFFGFLPCCFAFLGLQLQQEQEQQEQQQSKNKKSTRATRATRATTATRVTRVTRTTTTAKKDENKNEVVSALLGLDCSIIGKIIQGEKQLYIYICWDLIFMSLVTSEQVIALTSVGRWFFDLFFCFVFV